ncbi:MAG TPA: hypothetical protein VGL89_10105 [Candidatus Koribacter sp.]|jgi:uncharacterized membrane protein YagU involved in acid resistance
MRNFQRDLAIGAVAGAAAAAAMSAFQGLWLKQWPTRNLVRPRTDVEVMKMIAGRTGRKAGIRLSRGQREAVGLLLHYGFGAAAGAMYAVLAEESELVSRGFGAVFGTLFFAAGDAFAPKLVKPKVHKSEAISQFYEWMTHVVYGVTLEAGRRAGKAVSRQAA